MVVKSLVAAIAAALSLSAAVFAQETIEFEEDIDLFDVHLYEPEFVLEHAGDINLSREQRAALIDEIVAIQGDITRMSLEASEVFGPLESYLEADVIDPALVMPIVNRLMEIENETKRRYLTLMIGLHNDLSPGQRAALDDLREDWFEED